MEDASGLERARRTLGSLSDLMKHLEHPITERAQLGDGGDAHSLERRLYSEALVSEEALLAAMLHVDLHTLRGRRSETVEPVLPQLDWRAAPGERRRSAGRVSGPAGLGSRRPLNDARSTAQPHVAPPTRVPIRRAARAAILRDVPCFYRPAEPGCRPPHKPCPNQPVLRGEGRDRLDIVGYADVVVVGGMLRPAGEEAVRKARSAASIRSRQPQASSRRALLGRSQRQRQHVCPARRADRAGDVRIAPGTLAHGRACPGGALSGRAEGGSVCVLFGLGYDPDASMQAKQIHSPGARQDRRTARASGLRRVLALVDRRRRR